MVYILSMSVTNLVLLVSNSILKTFPNRNGMNITDVSSRSITPYLLLSADLIHHSRSLWSICTFMVMTRQWSDWWIPMAHGRKWVNESDPCVHLCFRDVKPNSGWDWSLSGHRGGSGQREKIRARTKRSMIRLIHRPLKETTCCIAAHPHTFKGEQTMFDQDGRFVPTEK